MEIILISAIHDCAQKKKEALPEVQKTDYDDLLRVSFTNLRVRDSGRHHRTRPRMRNSIIRPIIAKLLLLAAIILIPGCGSVETVKGDVIQIERRTLASDRWSYRLTGKGADGAILQKVQLCPVQERRVFREIKVTRESGAISATAGVGCSFTKIGEFSERIFGHRVEKPSSCRGHSVTDREATGRQVKEPWKTVRREACGVPLTVPPGGKIRVTVIRSRESKDYPVGEGGTIRFSRETMTKFRIFFTILRDMEIEGRYKGASWRQKLSLE